MAYYTKVLLPDEQVRTVGRLHWAIYLKAWICLLLATLAGLDFLHLRSSTDAANGDSVSIVLEAVAAAFVVFGLLLLLSAWLRRVTTEIVVTDRRIIFKEGFVRRRTMEMNMNKVETVDVVQSILGRIFNYGTILIRGTGSSYEPLRLIGNPLALRTAIVAQ
ncbi:MAG: rane-flanked domain protein [Rhodospirillales bacterium]|nr:rane-flanked domain protein [Rhodospirillales bacterium]